MPASIPIPSNFVAYNGLLVPEPWHWSDQPQEGELTMPVNIQWGTDDKDKNGTPTGTIQINVANTQLREFRRVRSIYVDNISSGADVTFLFPDTAFRFTVPGGTEGMFPVTSFSRAFYVTAPNALSSDQTYMQVLNTLPPPFAVVKSVFMAAAVSFTSPITTGMNVVIVPATVSGTLVALQIEVSNILGGAGAGKITLNVSDGDLKNLAGVAAAQNNAVFTGMMVLLQLQAVNLRFHNGLFLTSPGIWGGTAFTSGDVMVNAYYRTP